MSWWSGGSRPIMLLRVLRASVDSKNVSKAAAQYVRSRAGWEEIVTESYKYTTVSSEDALAQKQIHRCVYTTILRVRLRVPLPPSSGQQTRAATFVRCHHHGYV